MRELLTASQLCDLLNYVLELPRMTVLRRVTQEAIHPVAVSCWVKKRRRWIEGWAEYQLEREKLLPRLRKKGNIPHFPCELIPFKG